MEKIVIAQKQHVCSCCDRIIAKGERYILIKGRAASFDDDDNQNGIEYYTCRLCLDTKACNDALIASNPEHYNQPSECQL